jgi:hypothetical protein
MNSKGKKQNPRSGKDQADGQGENRRDPFEAASPQPKDSPTRRSPAAPADEENEERSNLADVGEAEEQEGVEGMKKGAAQQDPPATLPQELRHERRNNM